MKKYLFAALAVVIAVGVGVYYYSQKGSSAERRFKTEKAVSGDVVASVYATGTLNAVTTVLVGTQVSGTIKEIRADFNSTVKKGQVIATIDPLLFEAQVEQARSNLLVLRANVQKAQAEAKNAEASLARKKELFQQGLISAHDLDEAERDRDVASAFLNSTEAEVEKGKASLKLVEANLSYTRITSPVNGTVVSRSVDVGQTVAASFQTPTLFTIAEDLTKMQVNCSIAEADIGRIKKGLSVEFTVDAYPDEAFEAVVHEIRISPIVVQNVVTYDVIARVSNPGLKLKPGMTANVTIVFARRDGVLKVPNAALRFSPSNEKVRDDVVVWAQGETGPIPLKVVAGVTDGSFTEVVSGEVVAGQDLIVDEANGGKEKARPAPRLF